LGHHFVGRAVPDPTLIGHTTEVIEKADEIAHQGRQRLLDLSLSQALHFSVQPIDNALSVLRKPVHLLHLRQQIVEASRDRVRICAGRIEWRRTARAWYAGLHRNLTSLDGP
jgi:hypothetical protein